MVGSIYEFDNIKTKEFDFFDGRMEPTDDSILTIATADWLLSGGNPGDYYLRYAQAYQCVKNPREITVANCITARTDRGISNIHEGSGVVEGYGEQES